MEQVMVRVEVEINPTESEEKVKAAVANILGNASITITPSFKGSILKAEGKGQDSLIKFRNVLRSDRIRDAARKALYRKISESSISFCLNKQVAYAGHVSFCGETAESPLGPIKVTVETDNPGQLIDWLAEKTA